MRLDELFLVEAINQDLALRAEREVVKAFKEFVRDSHPEVSAFLGIKKYEDAYKAHGEWDEHASKLRDRIFDHFSTPKMYEAREKNDPWYQDTILELKHILELTMQDVARDYVEDKYGKIEVDPDNANLSWLEHIVVNLDFKGVDDFHPDQKADSGGYFDRHANGRKRNFLTRYGTEIDWNSESVRGIKIYTSQESLWTAYVSAFSEYLHEDYFGEALEYDRLIERWSAEPLSTFVHEVVHLEQELLVQNHVRGRKAFPAGADRGITLLPYPGKPRAKGGGRRGGNFRKLQSLDPKDPSYADKWADYLGSPDEVEAHAAGAAAKLILTWLREDKSHFSHNARDKQTRLNHHIDDLVQDFQKGYITAEGSIAEYDQFVKSKIGDGRAYRRVWQRFAKRLIRHLLSHKVVFEPSSDWEREDLKDREMERRRNQWGYKLQNRD